MQAQQPNQNQPLQQVAQQPQQVMQQQPVQGISPLEAIQQTPGQSQTVNVVEVEGQQENIIQQAPVTAGPGKVVEGLPQTEENMEEQTIIEDSLEELKEDYDDAKLNSIIIEQVKELIEIDTNLNNKIEDVKVDLKKESEEREKLQKQLDEHKAELKELETSIDKFIALYELVTNQFNPFVKQGDPDTAKKMQGLMEHLHPGQTPAQAIPEPPKPKTEADTLFVTKSGASVKTIQELVTLLETMPDDEFEHHVNDHKNDFSAWIHYAVKNDEFAKKVAPIRTKKEMIEILKTIL